MNATLRASACLLAIALAGCSAVGPNYRVPDAAVVKRPAAQAAFIGATDAPVSVQTVQGHWWKLYEDPKLDALVEQALQANTGVREAAAHLRRALSVAEQVDAERGPQAQAEAGVRRARESGEAYLLPEKVPVVNEGDVGIRVSYQLDLFGQLARGEEAAQAHVEASQAAQDLARVTVVAEIVKAYIQGCANEDERRVALRALDLQQASARIVQRLADAGRGQAIDVARAQSQVEALRAGLPRFDVEHSAIRYRLAALLGRTPAEMPEADFACQQQPHLAQAIPVGDGAALLKRRPDVRQAERRLAASTALIGVATADLYPHIVLGASAGLTGLTEHLGQERTQRWGLGPLISWQIPDQGAIARVKVAQADADAALAHFDGVVLEALRETETALSTYARDMERRAHWQAALDQARLAARQDRQLYEAGRAPLQKSLDADRSLAAVEMKLASSDSVVAMDQVRLFLALGGGWEP